MKQLVALLFLLSYSLHVDGQSISDSSNVSTIFDFLYDQEARPHITISTDAKQLLRTSSKKEYQPASMTINIDDEQALSLKGEIKARGFMRKKVCRIPPVKFDFDKDDLDSLGYSRLDKLKFVFPCSDTKGGQEKLLKEYFLYGLYSLVDTNALQARLVDLTMEYEGEQRFDFTAILLEDEENYGKRKNARVIEAGKLKAAVLDRPSFVNMIFFQYMIANTDWAVHNRHNLEMVKLANMTKPTAIAYDFDYAGFVGQSYALPHESLPISSVNERYFFSYPMSEKEFNRSVNFYKAMKDRILNYCDSVTYMNASSKAENKAYLTSFFKLLEYPKGLKQQIKIQ